MRFRVNASEYIKISSTSGAIAGEYITLAGTYVFTATDRYNGDEVTFTVIINVRDTSVTITNQSGEVIKLSDGLGVIARNFRINDLTALQISFLHVYVDSVRIDCFDKVFIEFGSHIIKVRDRFSGANYTATVTIEARESLDDGIGLFVNQGEEIEIFDGEEIIVFAVKAGATLAHQEIIVNGSIWVCAGEFITESGIFNVVVRDIYSGKYISFTVIILEMTELLNIAINNSTGTVTSGNYQVRNFRIDVQYALQRQYLRVYLNGELYNFSGQYVTEFGTHVVKAVNIFTGVQVEYSLEILPRILELSVKYNDDQAIKLVAEQQFETLRFRLDDVAYLLCFATVTHNSNLDFSNFVTTVGTYSFELVDKYNGQRATITVKIVLFTVSMENAENKSIAHQTVIIYFNASVVNIELRINGRMQVASVYNGALMLDCNGGESHVYILFTNLFNPRDTTEIFLIIRGEA